MPRSRAWPKTCWPTSSAACPGVAVVNVNGSLKRELSVLLRSEKLREYEVSVTEVVAALRAQNATAPVGKVRGTLEDQSIRLVGRIEVPADFGQIVIKRRGSELVRLAQVAVVGRLCRTERLLGAQRQPQRGPDASPARAKPAR